MLLREGKTQAKIGGWSRPVFSPGVKQQGLGSQVPVYPDITGDSEELRTVVPSLLCTATGIRIGVGNGVSSLHCLSDAQWAR